MEKFFLRHATKSLFATVYFPPPFRMGWDTASCLAILESPHPSVLCTTRWIASRLSGVEVGTRPPAPDDSNSGNLQREAGDTHRGLGEDLIKSLRKKWERHTVLFNYIILQDVTIWSHINRRIQHIATLIETNAACATHLFEKTVWGNRKGVVEECYIRIPLQVGGYD